MHTRELKDISKQKVAGITEKSRVRVLEQIVLRLLSFIFLEGHKMFLTIARLTGSIATGIALNWFVNYLKKKKIRKEIQNDRK